MLTTFFYKSSLSTQGSKYTPHSTMGWNELHALAVSNDAAEIKESILGRGTIVRERTELTGMMPIHKACMYGRYAAFQELYELGTIVEHVILVSIAPDDVIFYSQAQI